MLRTGAGRVQQFARAHPYWTCAIGAALVGAGVCLVAPQAALGALGWQAAGPVAGEPCNLRSTPFPRRQRTQRA